jgi:hypothetical protein
MSFPRAMTRSWQLLLLILLAATTTPLSTQAQGGAGGDPEIGNPSSSHAEFPKPDLSIDDLQPKLGIGLQYNHFRSQDENGTYGGIPLLTATLDFALSTRATGFLSVGYGQTSGDPYFDQPGFIGSGDENELTVLPMELGFKTDFSRNSRLHFYLGAALEMAWVRETYPTGVSNQDYDENDPSGLLFGFNLFMGPEFKLGEGGHHLGLQVGYAGMKGDINNSYHSIDMSGARVRAYWALSL